MKALGIGIGFEVKRLNFQLKESLTEEVEAVISTALQVDSRPVQDWCFQETLVDDHCIAVAMVAPPESEVMS